MSKLISVIIPVYQVEQYLDQCIQSVVNQTYADLEIILVDDGSNDSCPTMCDEWAIRDSRIRVIHKKNGGLADARNVGLDICSGSYIGFVDSDDWISPEMYSTLVKALEQENADISACNITNVYPDKKVVWGSQASLVGDSETMLNLLYSDTEFPVCSWNKLYKKELWEGFRFPTGKICEDAFTTYLLVHKAKKIVQITEPLYFYRIRPESIMTQEFSPKKMDEEEAWRENYLFIKDQYPGLYKKAFSFYLQKVFLLLQSIPVNLRDKYSAEYTYLYIILKNNLRFILFQSTTSIKYRVSFLIDYLRQ